MPSKGGVNAMLFISILVGYLVLVNIAGIAEARKISLTENPNLYITYVD